MLSIDKLTIETFTYYKYIKFLSFCNLDTFCNMQDTYIHTYILECKDLRVNKNVLTVVEKTIHSDQLHLVQNSSYKIHNKNERIQINR